MAPLKTRGTDKKAVPADLDPHKIPQHIAMIMDGNGRWARKRRLPRIFGHRAGIQSVREIAEACSDLGVRYLTLYAFSSENWTRPESEVGALMRLLEIYLLRELPEFQRNRIRVLTIGGIEGLPPRCRKALRTVVDATRDNQGLSLCLALNYGGRQEIVRAIERLIDADCRKVTIENFQKYLDTSGIPDPDLVIRTSGEMRLSNFLLWQSAYSEFYTTPVLWPDFRRNHLLDALREYQGRERRFGGVMG